jgi:hypothetical protein
VVEDFAHPAAAKLRATLARIAAEEDAGNKK